MSNVVDITLDFSISPEVLSQIREFIEQYNIPLYGFTPISNSSTEPYTVFRQPSINQNGAVAFEGFFDAASPPGAILTGAGADITRVADQSRGLDITFGASINEAGTVSFTGNVFGPSFDAPLASSAVYVGNGGDLVTLADRSTQVEDFGTFQFFGPSAINNRQDVLEVAFVGINTQADVGVFLSQGGNVTTLASSLGEFDSFRKQIPTIGGDGPFTIYAPPSLNDQGTAYFTASLDNGDRGIFSSSQQGDVQTIVDSRFDFDRFSGPSVNNQGTVAFLSQLDNGLAGIFSREFDGKLNVIATTDDPFSQFVSDPAINSKGKVAFQAKLDNGGEGIFVGSDPVLDKVIAVGDRLGSSTVSRLLFTGRDAFNDAGQLAFGAVLADGTERVFRADPFLTSYKARA